MEVRAVAKYIRLSPAKVRQVADLVRGKNVDDALAILKFTPKRAAKTLSKVINSAVANAENNNELDRTQLYISKAFVDQGPSLKRWRARAYGRADIIKHRTSHITVVVSDGKEG